MKILFDCPVPFQFAHGGAQTQVEETMRAVAGLRNEVEPLRWWDARQTGDVVHYFGLPGGLYTTMAHTRGIPVVATVLLTSNCNHPEWRLRTRGFARKCISRAPGGRLFSGQTSWGDYALVDRFVVGLEAEAKVLDLLYGVSRSNISVVSLGLAEAFLRAPAPARDGGYLVTSGTITGRKRSVELARMARAAGVPILFLGKPYSTSDPYWKEFEGLVDGKHVIHRGHLESQEEMVRILGSARGFVIFSRHENWCLSAHEAAACGLPVLVQDQPWSRERFGAEASYLVNGNSPENPARLKAFFEAAPRAGKPAIKHHSWSEVAGMLAGIYSEVFSARRGQG